jgi:hypothetical protein
MRNASSYWSMPRGDLGVARGRELDSVQVTDRVQAPPPAGSVHSVGVREVEDWVAFRAALDALVDGREEAAAPERCASIGRLVAGDEDHERRQAVGLAAEPVRDPRAHAGPSELGRPRVKEHLGRSVVELIGVQRPDDGEIVHDAGESRQQLGDLGAVRTVARELVRCAEHFGHALDEREALLFEE